MKSLDASSNLDNIPALKVLARARVESRLPHAILFTGQNERTFNQSVLNGWPACT
jgi:hypothetical protein